MKRTPTQLRDDALAIWQAAVAAVDSRRLIEDNVTRDGSSLRIADREIPFPPSGQTIAVVGAGKAGAAMAEGVERALRDSLDQVVGWVNVPSDCVRRLDKIHLHAARPAGQNEPTEAGVQGAREILRIVQQLKPDDVCLCLISGGGSALLPLPKDGITLHDKQTLTRHLSGAGANIQELNTVRKQLSAIKGGGLARACRAGHLITLIISDVIGDPLDVIASGPTVPDTATAADALNVLAKYQAEKTDASHKVWELLESTSDDDRVDPACTTSQHVIGNNATAVEAAAAEARQRGYQVCAEPAAELEGDVSVVAETLADRSLRMRDGKVNYDCLITGGEPTVTLAPAPERGRGGRNQQLVAVAMERMLEILQGDTLPPDVAFLSGGTDGEDGPTDAAGAWASNSLGPVAIATLRHAIEKNDAYSFFGARDALIKTGPTHTNVCDVRVAVVSR